MEDTAPETQPPGDLLATKLARPPLRRGALERPWLLARLDAALEVPLSVVAAPPGFGKTTLLAAWLAGASSLHPASFCWLSLDPGDDDLALFVSYLVAALRTAAPGVGAATLALLRAPQPPPPPALLTPLLNDLAALDRDVVLVLDDYHAVEAPAAHAALAFLLERAPARLHLVLATRSDPPLPLARLRARGQLLELRARDLRFDLAEAAAFLRAAMGLDLADAEVAALEARTEGWAAGLQLAALALRAQPDRARFVGELAASGRYIADYLTEEVLERLPAHLRDFVLRTSILERLSGPLCDAALGVAVGPDQEGPSSEPLLRELERRNLFLAPLDGAGQWYRYHPLFAEVARARLRQGAPAGELAALYRRAADAEPSAERGVEYLLAGGLWDEAAARVLGLGAAALAQGRYGTLQRWVAALPPSELAARPRLAALRGIALARQGELAEAETLLTGALAGCERAGDAQGAGEALAELAVLALVRGDLDASLARIEAALALPAAPAARVFALMFAIGVSSYTGRRAAVAGRATELFALLRAADDPLLRAAALAGAHSLAVSLPGELEALERLCRAGLAELGDQLSLARVGAEVGLTHIAWLRGRLDEALGLAGRARATSARLGAYGYVEPQLLSVEGIVAAARGDLETAAERFTMALAAEQQVALYAFARPGQLYALARVRWQQGRLAELRALAAQMAAAGTGRIALKAAMGDLLAALLALAEGRGAAAEALLAPLAAREPEVGLMAVFGSARPPLALLALRRGRPAAAAAILDPLLAACARDGTPGRLLLEGPWLAPLLRAAAEHGAHRAFAAQALALLEAQGAERQAPGVSGAEILAAGAPAPQRLEEPLTERELQVLRLLAAGCSNREVAERLVIAIGTAKRHVSNLAGKLGAPSRLAAVARARELGLLAGPDQPPDTSFAP